MNQVVEFFRKPIPREHFRDLHAIPYDKLKLWGFELIIFDYDNTLAPFGHEISHDVIASLQKIMKMGFKVAVVTNASYGRTKALRSKVPDILVFARAKKPGLRVLKLAVKTLDVEPSKSVFVGDLFFTDIIAGNRLGMYTILVEPYPGVGFILSTLTILEKLSYYAVLYTFGWIFRIGDLISPNEWAKNIFDVNYDRMISKGIKLFVFDMDNTVAKWRAKSVDPKVIRFLQNLSGRANVVILSNGNSPALKSLKDKVKIEVVTNAHKPLTTKISKIMKKYKVTKGEVAVVGDQLFTDILMANLSGLYSVKVEPISKDELWFTKILRTLEKIVKPFTKEKPSIRVDKNEWESTGN
jgi:HAD superfamily phosphatase (TIGR01668 family)|uniref:YqeG family HAD IIIA-type phosphatase n=1 Tax=Mesoaciditoga lauensis TaxID=1495039 RepID=A0A7V3REQ0_9BACT